MTVAIALFTSPRWTPRHGTVDDADAAACGHGDDGRHLRPDSGRRDDAAYRTPGSRFPDFPLMFGGIIPDHWDARIAVHFAHRVGALVVTLAILATSAHVWYTIRQRRELTRPATLLVALVAVQVTLGALTVLSRRDVWINSAHVVCGALVLATSLVITLRSWRVKFGPARCSRRQARRVGRRTGVLCAPQADSGRRSGARRMKEARADVAPVPLGVGRRSFRSSPITSRSPSRD